LHYYTKSPGEGCCKKAAERKFRERYASGSGTTTACVCCSGCYTIYGTENGAVVSLSHAEAAAVLIQLRHESDPNKWYWDGSTFGSTKRPETDYVACQPNKYRVALINPMLQERGLGSVNNIPGLATVTKDADSDYCLLAACRRFVECNPKDSKHKVVCVLCTDCGVLYSREAGCPMISVYEAVGMLREFGHDEDRRVRRSPSDCR